MRTLTLSLAATLVGATLLTAPLTARWNNTVIVSGNMFDSGSSTGWLFNRDPNNVTPYEFNFDAPSIGFGSLYVPPIAATPAANKFIGELFMHRSIADLESISYDFKIGSNGDQTDARQFYLNVYAIYGGSPSTYYDCRYDVVPSTGSTDEFTTVTFSTQQSYPVTKRGNVRPGPCPATPAGMGPGARVHFVSLNVGDTAGADAGLDGYLDNVVVTTTADVTTYDFEPELPQTADACKNGGWQNYGGLFRNQGLCIKFVNTGKR